ncbi:50S ribosomal protein L7/L12 [Patescibacteria group bacterium]|nr:50S ribosomal protein L7/L12 [Patescibacteria group bacterium]
MAKETKEEILAVPEKFKSLVESIEKLSVLELAELVKILEEKFGVSAAVPMAAAAPADEGEAAAEEKSSFDVVLAAVGEQKIEVIKVVRDVTGKGLKEAKDLVDAAVSEPQVLKEGAGKDEAQELQQKLTGVGAKVELK